MKKHWLLAAMLLSAAGVSAADVNDSFAGGKFSADWKKIVAMGAADLAFTENPSGGVKVTGTPDRSRFYEILTPQGFKYIDIKACYAKAIEEGITATDDTALAELLNLDVYLTKGLYSNLKITTPEDIAIASEIVRSRGESEPFRD